MCADPVPLVGARDIEPWGHSTDLRRAVAHGISGYECLARADMSRSARNVCPRVERPAG